ncbi:hypothetical protein [Luteitalea sp. TBR-22]|nr:hypothetical protein [Luteitalea sp. TBR-22]
MGVKSAVVAFVSRVCVVSLVIAGLASSEGCRSSSPSPRAVSPGVGVAP